MDAVTELIQIDWKYVLSAIFIIMSSVISITVIIEKFAEAIGKPIKWFNKRNKDHELLMSAVQSLSAIKQKHEEDISNIEKQYFAAQKDFTGAIESINNKLDMMRKENIDKDISDMRWEITNVADKLSNGKTIGKEVYKHALRTYDKYERIIHENNLTNSEVDVSIDIIRQSYKEKKFDD